MVLTGARCTKIANGLNNFKDQIQMAVGMLSLRVATSVLSTLKATTETPNLVYASAGVDGTVGKDTGCGSGESAEIRSVFVIGTGLGLRIRTVTFLVGQDSFRPNWDCLNIDRHSVIHFNNLKRELVIDTSMDEIILTGENV